MVESFQDLPVNAHFIVYDPVRQGEATVYQKVAALDLKKDIDRVSRIGERWNAQTEIGHRSYWAIESLSLRGYIFIEPDILNETEVIRLDQHFFDLIEIFMAQRKQ